MSTFEAQVSSELAALAVTIADRWDFHSVKARELMSAVAQPSHLPERLDQRALALSALVLGGMAERALEIGRAVLTAAVEDDQLRQVVMIAGLVADRYAAVCEMLDADPTAGARTPVEMATALAARLVADGRYSEAADWLDVGVAEPYANAPLEPILRFVRLRLWMTCRAKCSLPVFDQRTGTIELPETLRERCVTAIEDESRSLVAVVAGTRYELTLALALMEWARTLTDMTLLDDERVRVILRACAQKLGAELDTPPSAA